MSAKLQSLSEHVATLLTEIVSDPDYATGRKRYPRTVTLGDAGDVAEAFQEQVDRAVDTRAELAKRRLVVIACGRGCNTCCEEPIMITLPEAVVVARWLKLPENAAVLEGFLARYPAWAETVGDRLDKLSIATSRGDDRTGVELHVETRAMCPFNHEGDCSVYPVRPILCREAHALDTAEHCAGWSEQPVRTLPFPQLDEFIVKVKTAMWALHHALPGTQRLRMVALPAAVRQVLDQI